MALVPYGGGLPVPRRFALAEFIRAANTRAPGFGGALGSGRAIPLGPAGSTGTAQAMGNPFTQAASQMAAGVGGGGGIGGAGSAAEAAAAGTMGRLAQLRGIPAALRATPAYFRANPMQLLRAGVRGAGGGGLAAILANPVIEAAVPGSNTPWEQGLQGAATGAGIGAGVASAIPIPGLSTAAGALVGGLGGGLIGLLTAGKGGGKPKTYDDVVFNALQTSGLDANTQGLILRQYQIESQFATNDEERQLARNNARTAILGALNQGQRFGQLAPPEIMAIQALAGQLMAPHSRQIEQQGTADAAILNELASSLPTPALQASTRIEGQNRLSGAQRLAAAYRAQAQLLPSSYSVQLEQEYRAREAADAVRQLAQGQGNTLAALLGQ